MAADILGVVVRGSCVPNRLLPLPANRVRVLTLSLVRAQRLYSTTRVRQDSDPRPDSSEMRWIARQRQRLEEAEAEEQVEEEVAVEEQ